MTREDQAKFSVLISVYQRESVQYLDECMSSILEQTVLPFEIVVVKDGPLTDALEKSLLNWSTRLPLKLVSLSDNRGLGVALAVGLRECSCELVARMDADDICFPNRFETQLKFFKRHPNTDIVGSYAKSFSETDSQRKIMTVPIKHNDITKLVWSCPFIHPSVMYRRSSILKIGSYSQSVARRQEDYELWIRCAKNRLVFANIEQPLILYRKPNSHYVKNNFTVAVNRFLVGFPAVWEFDRRLVALFALCFPLIRSLVPVRFRKCLTDFLRQRLVK